MSIFTVRRVDVSQNAPTNLGEIIINVTIGQTVTITKTMLMGGNPPYFQEGTPMLSIGSIEIQPHYSDTYLNLLSQTNNATYTIGYLTNNGSRLYAQNQYSGNITNGYITSSNLNNNLFKVVGVKAGTKSIYFKATAQQTSTTESSLSTIEGTITINVVTTTNQRPNNVDLVEIDCVKGQMVNLGAGYFGVNYQDPENDPPKSVKITGLSKGKLDILGVTYTGTFSVEVPWDLIQVDGVIFISTPDNNVGEIINLTWAISDWGSGLYTTNKINKIKIIDVLNIPPTFLGNTTIIIQQGQTAPITKDMLMGSTPPYEHPNTPPTPIGSIEITGYIGQPYNALSITTTPLTYCHLKNGTNNIFYDVDTGSVVAGDINQPELWNNSFNVTGANIGTSIVKYRATAYIQSSELESSFSSVEGIITIITKAPQGANQPPSGLVGGSTTVINNNSVILDHSFFYTGYVDPENDPISYVRFITSPPADGLLYNGAPIPNNTVIPMSDISSGMVMVVSNGVTPIGSAITFTYTVGDAGSGMDYGGSVLGSVMVTPFTPAISTPTITAINYILFQNSYNDPIVYSTPEVTPFLETSILDLEKLTFRDFTTDMTPFDPKYKYVKNVKFVTSGYCQPDMTGHTTYLGNTTMRAMARYVVTNSSSNTVMINPGSMLGSAISYTQAEELKPINKVKYIDKLLADEHIVIHNSFVRQVRNLFGEVMVYIDFNIEYTNLPLDPNNIVRLYVFMDNGKNKSINLRDTQATQSISHVANNSIWSPSLREMVSGINNNYNINGGNWRSNLNYKIIVSNGADHAKDALDQFGDMNGVVVNNGTEDFYNSNFPEMLNNPSWFPYGHFMKIMINAQAGDRFISDNVFVNGHNYVNGMAISANAFNVGGFQIPSNDAYNIGGNQSNEIILNMFVQNGTNFIWIKSEELKVVEKPNI